MDYIAAEEASFASFSRLTTHTTTIAAAKSSYKQPQSTLSDKSDPPALRRCRHCKAYGNKCSKCDKSHHLPKVCRSSPRAAAVISSQVEQHGPPSYPREVDNGVDWTGGRKEGGDLFAMETEVPTRQEIGFNIGVQY